MSAKKITLDHFRELLKSELPRGTQLAAGTALGTGGTLLMAGTLSAGLMRVYNQNSAHRWFWEDHLASTSSANRGFWQICLLWHRISPCMNPRPCAI